MKPKLKKWPLFLFLLSALPGIAQLPKTSPPDEIAEKMLLYQRDNGGWPQYGGDPTNYSRPIDATLKNRLIADKGEKDATIDDQSTTREINYLLDAFQKTHNPAYLKAAEKGITYLLEAQNTAGGWPQKYPDSSRYHKHITYNDNAMIDVLWIVKKLAKKEAPFTPVADSLQKKAEPALQKGIQCILKTQIKQNGRLTAWCAQHDSQSLLPANARAFELASISGAESVGIVRFLMSIDHPSEDIKTAIRSAVAWFEAVKIPGINIKTITDSTLSPPGRDRVVYADPNSTLWARFYDLDTNTPLFVDRSGVRKATLAEIDRERRNGYAYYGKWPEKLLEKEYPRWRQKWDNQ